MLGNSSYTQVSGSHRTIGSCRQVFLLRCGAVVADTDARDVRAAAPALWVALGSQRELCAQLQQGKFTRQTRCRHGGRRRRRRRRRLPRRTRRPQSPQRQPRRACRTVARGRSLPRPRPSRRPRPTSGGGSQAARGAAPPPTAARRAGGAARAQQAVRDPAGRPAQGRVGVRLRVRVQVGVRVGGYVNCR